MNASMVKPDCALLHFVKVHKNHSFVFLRWKMPEDLTEAQLSPKLAGHIVTTSLTSVALGTATCFIYMVSTHSQAQC
jgi:hypothetical protein